MALSWLLVYHSLLLAASVGLLAGRKLFNNNRVGIALVVIFNILVTSLGLFYSFKPVWLISCLTFTTVILFLARKKVPNYSGPGLNFYLANYYLMTIGLFWLINFLFHLEVTLLTKILLMATGPLALLALPSNIIGIIEQYDVLCRLQWRRPRKSNPSRQMIINPQTSLNGSITISPKVTIQVPTHCEPPQIVIETLDKLAKVDYPNLEVMVIDNNTSDPKLWRPVEEHCRFLGPRFRFLHVENLKGAKAGALN